MKGGRRHRRKGGKSRKASRRTRRRGGYDVKF